MFCPCSKGRDYKRTGILGVREHWGILQAINHSKSFRFLVSIVLTLPSHQQGDTQVTRLVLRMEKLISPSSTPNLCPAWGLLTVATHLKPPLHTGGSPETFFLSPVWVSPEGEGFLQGTAAYSEVSGWALGQTGLGTGLTTRKWCCKVLRPLT